MDISISGNPPVNGNYCAQHPDGGAKCFDCVLAAGGQNGLPTVQQGRAAEQRKALLTDSTGEQQDVKLPEIHAQYQKYVDMDAQVFLDKFKPRQDGTTPVDLNNDGHVDRKELLNAFLDAGASVSKANVLIEAFFTILDPTKEGKVRTDIFKKEYINMGIYMGIYNLKNFVDNGTLHMLTKIDGSRDVFFTKEEVLVAFEKELGNTVAVEVIDGTFGDIDRNNSMFINITELYAWYYAHTIHLRTIDLKRRLYSIKEGSTVTASKHAIITHIESLVGEIKTQIVGKKRKEKRLLRKKNSPENNQLNRTVGKLTGVLELLLAVPLLDEETGEPLFDPGLQDILLVPIRDAIKLGAWDPNAPVRNDSDSDDD